jgi:hypothetical protein
MINISGGVNQLGQVYSEERYPKTQKCMQCNATIIIQPEFKIPLTMYESSLNERATFYSIQHQFSCTTQNL